jgi:hypothetical protein
MQESGLALTKFSQEIRAELNVKWSYWEEADPGIGNYLVRFGTGTVYLVDRGITPPPSLPQWSSRRSSAAKLRLRLRGAVEVEFSCEVRQKLCCVVHRHIQGSSGWSKVRQI